jgi:hypothetical protein
VKLEQDWLLMLTTRARRNGGNGIRIAVRRLLNQDDFFFGEMFGAPISDYGNAVTRTGLEILSPAEKITTCETIKILFDIPLKDPVELEFTHEGGFSKEGFYKAVHDGYTKIYLRRRRRPRLHSGHRQPGLH